MQRTLCWESGPDSNPSHPADLAVWPLGSQFPHLQKEEMDKPPSSYVQSSGCLFAFLASRIFSIPRLTPPRLSWGIPASPPGSCLPAFPGHLELSSQPPRPAHPMQSFTSAHLTAPFEVSFPPPRPSFSPFFAAIVPHITTHPLSLSWILL